VVLKREDGTRYYQPSSPFSPNWELPNRDDVGDQHPWSVGFQNTDFRDYRKMVCRFPNEGGILGPTALPTVRACLPPKHDSVGSFAWEQHENSVAYWGAERIYPDRMLEQWLGKSIETMSIEEYVYWGGLVQGEGLAEYIRNFRRRMFDCASAVFWMYNDCWPAVRSWTIVDYYGRRTPSFHPVRRAFAPLCVALACESGRVRVFGVNEGPEWEGDLRYGLFGLAGGLPVDVARRVTVPPNASTLLAEFDEAEWSRRGTNTHGAFAILSQRGKECARDRVFMPLFKEMVWPQPNVVVRQQGGKAVFESDAFAWRVCLDLDGEKPLPDNFFDVLPGIPTVLEWPAGLGEPRVLRVGNLCRKRTGS
jgi:beta-mannosidase